VQTSLVTTLFKVCLSIGRMFGGQWRSFSKNRQCYCCPSLTDLEACCDYLDTSTWKILCVGDPQVTWHSWSCNRYTIKNVNHVCEIFFQVVLLFCSVLFQHRGIFILYQDSADSRLHKPMQGVGTCFPQLDGSSSAFKKVQTPGNDSFNDSPRSVGHVLRLCLVKSNRTLDSYL
jgi:hypothetical protein